MKNYSLFHRTIQMIASSKPGVAIFSKLQHRLDKAVYQRTNGRKTMSSILAGVPIVTITTIGAKSGLPRTIPLLCIQDPQDPYTFAVIASNWGQKRNPSWYYNLKANPTAHCVIEGEGSGDYIAHEAKGAEYERFWQTATQIYKGFILYKERTPREHIPIFVLTKTTEQR